MIVKFVRKYIFLIGILVFACTIRMYQLGVVPIALHGDEVGVGYNAYALLTSGIDEYGTAWPLVLRADVAPLIFYATIPSIAIFGPTEFAVRLPSVIIGILSIVAFYLVIKELFSEKIALLATLSFSLSPWHIQISRIAHDAPYGLLLQLIATFLFLKGKSQKNFFMLLSFVFFGLSFYSYHSPRLTSPLLLLGLITIFHKELWRMKQAMLYGFVLFALIITPITLDFISKPIGTTRIGGISIFTREDTSIPITPLYFVKLVPTFIGNYVNQFNPYFLFFNTSSMRYFNISSVGLLFWWEIATIAFGLFSALQRKRDQSVFIFWWIAISVLPGSLTRGNPNAGRIFMLLPMVSLLSGLGLIKFFELFGSKKIMLILGSIIMMISIVFFSYQYFIDSPLRYRSQWNYGAKEVTREVLAEENQYEKIIVTSDISQGYIYLLFYGKKDPLWLQAVPGKIRHPFIGYSAFGKYEFRAINWNEDLGKPNTLIVASIEETPPNITPVAKIYSPSGAVLFNLITTKAL